MISSTRSETSFRGAAQNPLDRTQGDAFAEFMLGTITLVEDAVQIDEAQFRSTSFALYFDDTWKITPKLTQTLGLRYENAPPWEDHG